MKRWANDPQTLKKGKEIIYLNLKYLSAEEGYHLSPKAFFEEQDVNDHHALTNHELTHFRNLLYR